MPKTFRLKSTPAAGKTFRIGPPSTPAGLNLLLTSSLLSSVRAKASGNTQQWQDFFGRLTGSGDGGLTVVTGGGSSEYQAGSLIWIAEHALAYQCLKNSDPTTAGHHADKAIAMMLHGMRNNVRLGAGTRMYLGRGDGVQTVWNLPFTDNIRSSTFAVYLPTVQVKQITGHVTNSDTETVDTNHTIIKVSNTSDGPEDYTKRTLVSRNPTVLSSGDYAQSPEVLDAYIKWSGGTSQPGSGATYYVTYAVPLGSAYSPSNYTLNTGAGTVTFNTAPTSSQAVFVEYQYGTYTGGVSTLGYQQTGDGLGGFNNMLIDSSYTGRYLGKFLSIGYDWLYDYPGLTASIKSELEDLLTRWETYVAGLSTTYTSVANNYGAGHYCSRVFAAVALKGRGHASGASIMTTVKTFRTNNALPQVSNSPANGKATWKGGMWGEAWGYGDQATRNFLLPAIALEAAGELTPSEEKTWAGEMTLAILHGQPDYPGSHADGGINYQGGIWDGGDVYIYPAHAPSKGVYYLAATLTTDATYKGYLYQFINDTTQAQTKNFEDMFYRDPNGTANDWTDELPLHYHCPGPDLILARNAWDYSSTWMSFICGNLAVDAGHAGNNPGHLRIQRGADDLLIDVPCFTGLQSSTGGATFTPPDHKPTASNIVLLNSNGDGDMVYDWNTGIWYGTTGAQILAKDLQTAYVYAYGNPRPSWSKNTAEGQGGSAQKLDRCLFYVRPDIFVVYDRIDLVHSTDEAALCWYFKSDATLSTDSWSIAVGSSKLFGTTVCGSAITSTDSGSMTVGGVSGVHRVSVQLNTGTASQFQFCTAIQTGSSGASAYTVTRIVSGSDWEGVIVNGVTVCLFGQNAGPINTSGGKSYSYTGTNLATITHYVADLTPNQQYTLSGAASGTPTASAAGVLTFTTTGNGSSQTVTIT